MDKTRAALRAGTVWRVLESLLWAGVLGFAGWRLWPQVAAALAVGEPGNAAPAFAVTTLRGEQVTLESLRGRVVLVNFWATWCPPCRIEMPGFERVYRDKRDRGFEIVGLSTDQMGTAEVDDFLRERGITFAVAMAPEEVRAGFGGVRGLPTSFLIDRQGRVRHRVVGIFVEPTLRLAVDRLLAEPAPPDAASRPDRAAAGAR